MPRRIWWVRRDARLHDQRCLQHLTDCSALLPAYVVDDTAQNMVCIDGIALGFSRRSTRAQAFEQAGLQALQTALRQRGSDLLLLPGDPAQQLAELAAEWQADELVCSVTAGSDEANQQAAVFAALAAHNVRCEAIWQHTLIEPAALPTRLEQLPRVFTAFRTALEQSGWQASPANSAPTQLPPADLRDLAVTAISIAPPAIDPRSAFPFAAGEADALRRLDDYLFGKQAIRHYKASRNGLIGADYSSKFAPWLAQGHLSPRTIYAAIKDYEQRFGASDSSYWLVFELWWRDFFAYTAARYGQRLFTVGGIQRQSKPWRHDLADFAHWCHGQTGDALVDAGQRELACTGYLGNRARQNVASYLIHDLGIDWRWGAAWFEHHLLDYDPTSNYGNWQYIAGIGNDPRPLRRFDTQAQATRYDPDAAYRTIWSQP